jgi:hypothetical protein
MVVRIELSAVVGYTTTRWHRLSFRVEDFLACIAGKSYATGRRAALRIH